MRKALKIIAMIILSLITIWLAFASVSAKITIGESTNSDDKIINLQTPEAPAFNNQSGQVNASEIWITNEGDMDNVPDLYSTLDDRYVLESGDVMSGGLGMGLNLITNIGHVNADFTTGGGLNLANKLLVTQAGVTGFPSDLLTLTQTYAKTSAISIADPPVSSDQLISVTGADNLTTGNLLFMESDSPDSTARNLILLLNDNLLAVGTTILNMVQDANETVLFIDNNGGEEAIDIRCDGVLDTDFHCLDVTSNAVQTGGNLIRMLQQNTASTKASVFYQTMGTGNLVFFDHQGSTGTGLQFNRDGDSGGNIRAMAIDCDNAGAGGCWAIDMTGLTGFEYAMRGGSGGGFIQFGDTKGLRLGTGDDSAIYYDGTNMIFDSNRTGSGDAWFSRNVSATGYITRTTAWDNSRGSALDYIKSGTQLRDVEGKVLHDSFPEFQRANIQVRDNDNCWEIVDIVQEWKEILNDTVIGYRLTNSSDLLSEVEIAKAKRLGWEIKPVLANARAGYVNVERPRTECGTKIEQGVKIDEQISTHEQSIYELKEKVEMLETELCNKDNTYSWCK